MKSLFKLREELNEGTKYSSDFKISPEGRKIRARRINFGGYETDADGAKSQDQINKEFQDKLAGNFVDATQKKLDKIIQKRRKEETKLPQQNENVSLNYSDPPLVLVLKRKSVRMFSDGTTVALYHSNVLNKLFTVAFNPNMSSNYQAEEFFEQDLIEHKDGTSSCITEEDKSLLLNLYLELSEQNQQKMIDSILESEEQLQKIKNFALSNDDN